MDRAKRCPFCVTLLPSQTLVKRMLSAVSPNEVCPRCGRTFSRTLGLQVGQLYEKVLTDFEHRLIQVLREAPTMDRAAVLVQFGMHMKDAKVASGEVLLQSVTQAFVPQLAELARGRQGRIDIRQVEQGACTCVDVEAAVDDGKHNRRRLRIARIDTDGFIQCDLNQPGEAQKVRQIAR